MTPTVTLLALITGVAVGATFGVLGIPIPAPPDLAGVLGIVGLFLGYRMIEHTDVGFDLLGVLGVR